MIVTSCIAGELAQPLGEMEGPFFFSIAFQIRIMATIKSS
jgi:hypothetical protein